MGKIQKSLNFWVCNTGEGERERGMTITASVWVFLSNSEQWKSLGRTTAKTAGDTFPKLRVCIVVSCATFFVMSLSCWSTRQIRVPLQAGDCCCYGGACSSWKEPQVPVPARKQWMSGNECKARILVTRSKSVYPKKCKTRAWVLVWLLVTHRHSRVNAHCFVGTFRFGKLALLVLRKELSLHSLVMWLGI